MQLADARYADVSKVLGNIYVYEQPIQQPARSGCQTDLACRHTLAILWKLQFFEYRSVRYWSKEINGTRTGGQKK